MHTDTWKGLTNLLNLRMAPTLQSLGNSYEFDGLQLMTQLTHLDFSSMMSWEHFTELLKVIPTFPHLNHWVLHTDKYPKETSPTLLSQTLLKMTQLTHLEIFQEYPLGDVDTTRALGELTQLQELVLTQWNLLESDMFEAMNASLMTLGGLTDLVITGNQMNETQFKHLFSTMAIHSTSLRSLEMLNFLNTEHNIAPVVYQLALKLPCLELCQVLFNPEPDIALVLERNAMRNMTLFDWATTEPYTRIFKQR